MICCKVHYTLCLIMNFTHIVMYFRLHQQSAQLPKNMIWAHQNKGGKNQKRAHIIIPFLQVTIHKNIILLEILPNHKFQKKKRKGENMEDVTGRMNVDSGIWNIVLLCDKILLPSEIINRKRLLHAFPLQREKSSFWDVALAKSNFFFFF